MIYKIKNWSQFQQYKDDRPVHWIKLHTKLLNDFSFGQLPEVTQLHVIKLWLLAAERHGYLEGDEKWFGRAVGADSIDLEGIVRAGFLVRTDSYGEMKTEHPRGEERREEKRGVRTRFTPPTESEIEDYILEKNLSHVVGSDFFNHYSSNGWKVGKNGMKCWKSALTGWNSRNKPKEEFEGNVI